MHRLAAVVTALATGVAIIVVLISIDFSKILPTLQQLRTTTIVVVTLLLLLNFLLAYFRFKYTLSAFGATIGGRAAAHAFSLGTLASQFLLNVVGQSLTRAMVLQSAGVPMSLTVVATYLERLIAFGTLGVAAVVSALVLFGSIGLQLYAGGAYFLSLGIGLSATLGIAGVRAAGVVITPERFRFIASGIMRLTPAVMLSFLVHGVMFGAYFILALDFSSGVDFTKLSAAIVVVMFAAAIPISWAGWGLREFGAVYALSVVGMPSEAAVVIAVTIGALSLLLSLAMGFVTMIDGWRRPFSGAAPENFVAGAFPSTDAILFWPIGILIACLIFFQLRVPTGAGDVTVNIADPLAITAFFFALYLAVRDRFLQLFPVSVIYSICTLGAVLLLAAIVASLDLGLTQWALLNRLFGFLILVGYAAAAGLVLLVAGERGRVVLADTFVMSALLICAIEFIAFLIHYYVTPLPLDFFGYQFKAGGQLEGYAQNPNAFAFQLLMAMCVLIAFHPLRARRPEMAWSWLGVAAIAAIIVVVRTRAGILAGLVIGALAILLPRIPSRLAIGRKQLALIIAALVIAVLAGVAFRSSLSEFVLKPFNTQWRANAIESDALRWETVTAGIRQWLQYPFFGHGLGSFLLEREGAGAAALVIHSVPVWFLAEMGILGLGGYLLFVITLLVWGLARIRQSAYACGMVAAVAAFALMGLVHDIFYQRTFWFVIGLLFADATGRVQASEK